MKRIRIIFFVSVLLIITSLVLSMILIMYLPLKEQLQETIENNFIEMAYANSRILDTVLNSLESKAVSLSERLFILPDLKAYNNDEISKEVLLEKTEHLYNFAVNSTRDIAFSSRYVDDEKIYTVEVDETYFPIEYDNDITELVSFLKVNDNESFYVVLSPIFYQGEKIGIDEVVFHIPTIIEEENTIKLSFCIFNENYYCDAKGLIFSENDVDKIQIIKDNVYFLIPLDRINGGILFNIKKSDLFHQINKLSFNSTIYVIFIVLGIIIITYFTIIRTFNKAVDQIIFEKDEIEKLSRKDPLTNIYNRSYFNNYIESFFENFNKDEECIYSNNCETYFIMLDIDHFKEINDNFGHITGDSVLKTVAKIMNEELNQFNLRYKGNYNSYVYRYGGDEFTIFCPLITKNKVNELINTIIERIRCIDDFPFKIYLSYGISEVSGKEDIIQSLHKADQEMYKYKNNHVNDER